MKLRVPVEAPPDTDIGTKAKTFITTHGDLWNVGTADIRVVATDTTSICPSATIQVFTDNTPIFNNMVRVYFDKDGNVSGVIGGMTGRVLEPLDTESPSAVDALSFVKDEYKADPEQTAASTSAIVDPFFLTDSESAPRHAVVFSGTNGPDQPRSVYAVVKSDDKLHLAVAGKGMEYLGSIDDPCLKDPRFAVPLVISTGSVDAPSAVAMDFAHLAGLAISGSTVEDQAWAALANEKVQKVYGFRNPASVLEITKSVAPSGGRGWVRFQQVSQGLPVDGATITVSFSRAGIVSSVTGRTVIRPLHPTNPSVSASDAVASAVSAVETIFCGTNSDCATQYSQLAAEEQNAELRVVSHLIYPDVSDKPRDHLAWRIAIPGWTVFWDADQDSALLLQPNGGEVGGLPNRVRNFPAGDVVEIENGTPLSGVTPASDVQTLSDGLAEVNNYYNSIGRNSIDGSGFVVEVSADFTLPVTKTQTTTLPDGGTETTTTTTNEPFGNAKWCVSSSEKLAKDATTGAILTCPREGIIVGEQFVARDVVAHETGHGLVYKTAGLEYIDETGAVHEHYGDVVQSRAVSDSHKWLVGEDTLYATTGPFPPGAFRDMEHPERPPFLDPNHYALKNVKCKQDPATKVANCAHEWAGILNRAFVLSSDGDASMGLTGISSAKAGDIWIRVLTDFPDTLAPTSGFTELRAATQMSCRDSARREADAGGSLVTFSDCDTIWQAFNTVGVPGGEANYTFYDTVIEGVDYLGTHKQDQGQLYQGCEVSDHIIWIEDMTTGEVASSNIADGNSASLNGVTASVYARGSDTPNAVTGLKDQTYVIYDVSADWFFGPTVLVGVNTILSVPNGLTIDQCYIETPGDSRVKYRTTLNVNEWACCAIDATWGTTGINFGFMPTGCKVKSITLEESHKDGTINVAPMGDHGAHSWDLELPAPLPAENNVRYNINWYHSSFSGIFLRGLVDVEQPPGVNCALPGMTQVP